MQFSQSIAPRGALSTGVIFVAVCAIAVLFGSPTAALADGSAAESGQPGTQGGQKKNPQVLPEVTVSGTVLDEEQLVGKNKQPEWTTERRFPGTRIYVLPPGMVETETWWRGTYKKGGAEAHRLLTEVEIGLPGRWQLDAYLRGEGGTGDKLRYVGEQLEARYAFADWNKIAGNPTAYLEWKRNIRGADVVEGKILLGGQLKRGVHWGVNFSYEEETGGAREIERAFTFAIGKTCRDSRLSVGIEGVLEHVTVHDESTETAFLLGPSVQWRPKKDIHVDVLPLFGITKDAPRAQVFLVLGFNLRQGGKGEITGPVSSKTR